jgi:SAM-dependent methyltransferase
MENKVEEQYTNWVYPDPVEDMKAAIAKGAYLEIGDPLLYWPLMWPHKRNIDKLDILVAGCGSNQAAYYACRSPNWNVLGVDLSDSSLAHQKKLKEKHNLSNLRLEKLDLTKIKSLGLDFDFIVSTGVLHHLPDPDEGLAALKSVLRSEGVINLMVYGTSLRLGVYMMQEVFRTLGFKQTKSDVDIVRTTVESLHSEHVLKRYMKAGLDLKYDAGMVDTFLHPQDRSYSVKELFYFTRKASLEFLSWCDPSEYCLEMAIPAAHPLLARIHSSNLSNEEKYHIHDLLVQDRGTHRWLCAHAEYVKKCKIDFEGNTFLKYFIRLHRTAKMLVLSDVNKKSDAVVTRTNFGTNYEFKISYQLAQLLQELGNGSTSLDQALKKINMPLLERNGLIEQLRVEIKSLSERGHVYVFLPEKSN